jgi:hypothetical protein
MNKSLITKRFNISKFDKPKAKELAKRLKIKADNVEFVSKGYDGEAVDIVKQDRSVIKYVSTVSVDRDGEIIDPAGVDLTDFRKSKKFLWGHNHGSSIWGGGYPVLPLGTDEWIKADHKGILAKQQYANHQLANDVYNMHKDGHPLAASIGFIPIEWVDKGDDNYDKVAKDISTKYAMDENYVKEANRIYTKTYLLEHSDVPVACNPDALTLSVKSGDIKLSNEMFQELGLGEEEMNEELKNLADGINKTNEKLDMLIKALSEAQDEADSEQEEEMEEKGLTLDDVSDLLDNYKKNITNEIAKLTGKV